MVLFLQIILSNCSQNYHEESGKFQLRVSEYFDGEYWNICPYQVTDQKLKRRHHEVLVGFATKFQNFFIKF